MNEQTIQEKLDLLVELEATFAELGEGVAQEIAAVIPQEVKERIEEIEARFADQIHVHNSNIASIKSAIKGDVLELGSTVKGVGYMTVWSKGRVTWNGKGLSGYMVAHPEIEAFRKEGKPSVSIRRK